MIGASLGDANLPSNQDFGAFWQVFRKAVLTRNWQMLTQMCNFPVTVKGVLDRDPVYRVGRREFPKVFDQFLREGVFSANEELEYIRKTAKLTDSGRSVQRVGDMLFRKTDRGWLLDTLYMQYTSD
jgi:hypothetical protein